MGLYGPTGIALKNCKVEGGEDTIHTYYFLCLFPYVTLSGLGKKVTYSYI